MITSVFDLGNVVDRKHGGGRPRSVVVNGERFATLRAACTRYGVEPSVAGMRITRGWDVDKAVSTPTTTRCGTRKRTIEVNQEVRIVLTAPGAKLVNEWSVGTYPRALNLKGGDTFQIQLWTIMSIFGPHMAPGAPLYFKNGEVEVYLPQKTANER